MRLYKLVREQTIQSSLEEVFSFFSQPENLAKITPAKLKFQILTPGPIAMEKGALVDYIVSPLGFPMRWTTLITAYEPLKYFVDQQLRGPYAFWHHTHIFRKLSDNQVVMIDEVLYGLGFGVLGDWIHEMFVHRQIEMIFDFRQKVISDYFRAS